MSPTDRRTAILESADHCVKCGLCLPHCPTYGLRPEEAEGPRGRISLLQGLARGELAADETLQEHLDRCLGCRACEAVCPARVSYGELLDLGRAELLTQRPPGRRVRWQRRLGLSLAERPARLRAVAWLGWVYQRSGAQALARRLRLLPERLSRVDALLPGRLAAPRALPPHHEAHAPRRGRVALFTGCVGSAFDRRTAEAALEVLTALGYEVDVPPGLACCGALPGHLGEQERARSLARENLAAFANAGHDHIVYLASGCGAQLQDYGPLLGADAPWGGRLVELSQLLAQTEWPPGLEPAPLAKRVAVHEPCTLRNVIGGSEAAYRLLRRIPELEVMPLPGNARCCGAAGSYMLTQVKAAEQLRAPKLAAIGQLRPDYLVTSNIGCALHLAAGLGDPAPEVLHPVELLARQLTKEAPNDEHA